MSITHKLPLAVVSMACIVFGTANVAVAVTKLTFDELGSRTPVDNLTVKGVTFDFKNDSPSLTSKIVRTCKVGIAHPTYI